MTTSQLVTAIFVAVSIAVLLYVIFGSRFNETGFKKYIIATGAIYLSGTLLVAAIIYLNASMPVTFTIISEVSILLIFLFSQYIICRLGRNFNDIRSEIEKSRNSEDSASKNDKSTDKSTDESTDEPTEEPIEESKDFGGNK